MSEPKLAKQINDPQCGTLELAPHPKREIQPADRRQQPIHPLELLERAMQGDLTKEKVEIAKDLMQMAKDYKADEAKAAFAKAFLQLRRNMPEIYIDKEAKNDGKVVYAYCSEEEITKKIEPHLLSYGFTTLPNQSEDNGRVTMTITLIHEGGHQTTQSYTVHAGAPNRMRDATACDTGAATAAWRHLVMKMFGLKSRIRENSDARNLGSEITPEEAQTLQRRVFETGSDVLLFLKFAGVPLPDTASADEIKSAFGRIHTGKMQAIEAMLRRKESTK